MSMGLRVYNQRCPLAKHAGIPTGGGSCNSFFAGNKNMWSFFGDDGCVKPLCVCRSDGQLLDLARHAPPVCVDYDPAHDSRMLSVCYGGQSKASSLEDYDPIRRITGPIRPPVNVILSRWGEICACLLRWAYRDEALRACDADDGVVAVGSSCGGVDEEVDLLVDDLGRARLREQYVQMRSFKDLLQGVEREPGELALDEIWTVLLSSASGSDEAMDADVGCTEGIEARHLHDGFELDVSVGALPSAARLGSVSLDDAKGEPWWTVGSKRKMGQPGHKVQHVDAVDDLPLRLARGAGQLHAEECEDWELCDLIPHAEQARVKVDL